MVINSLGIQRFYLAKKTKISNYLIRYVIIQHQLFVVFNLTFLSRLQTLIIKCSVTYKICLRFKYDEVNFNFANQVRNFLTR